MGNCVNLEYSLSEKFEIKNGLLGAQRDILMRLIELMTFKNDLLIQNLIGMSGESVSWINHFHFTVARTFVERHIIPSKRERGKEITVKLRSVIFNLGDRVGKSILINILIKKNSILECTFKINRGFGSSFLVGICTPKQISDVVVNWLGNKDCGGFFCFNFCNSWVTCSGKYSRYFEQGGIKKEEEITAVVNNKNVNSKGGKMNIIRNQKRVPHTIVNIPKDGVHLGFSCYDGSVTLSIISLIHIFILPPPFNNAIRCIAYDFHGGFEKYKSKDEEGKEVQNIEEYYNVY